MTVQEFGALLQARREAKGLTIEELAARIKLSARTLKSIENGSMDGLPHAVYARGFVRSYAQLIGLDAAEIDEGLDSVFPLPANDAHPLPGPIDRQRNKVARSFGDKLIALLIVLVLIVLPVGAGWFIVTNYGGSIIDWIKKPFIATSTEPRHDTNETIESLGPSDAAPILETPKAAEPVPSSEPEQLLQDRTEADGDGTAVTDAPAPAAGNGDTASAAGGAGPEGSAAPQAPPPVSALPEAEAPAGGQENVSGEHTVQIIARETCWVRVRADGASPRSFELRQGESSHWPFKSGLELTLGNAGGVTVRYNGQPFDLNARSGDVKTVMFPPSQPAL